MSPAKKTSTRKIPIFVCNQGKLHDIDLAGTEKTKYCLFGSLDNQNVKKFSLEVFFFLAIFEDL